MKKSLYQNLGNKVGRYWAVSIPRTTRDDIEDTLLVGEKGWIFYANKARDRLGVCLVDIGGYEEITYCDFEDLDAMVQLIGGFMPVGRQAVLANNPNLRHND